MNKYTVYLKDGQRISVKTRFNPQYDISHTSVSFGIDAIFFLSEVAGWTLDYLHPKEDNPNNAKFLSKLTSAYEPAVAEAMLKSVEIDKGLTVTQ